MFKLTTLVLLAALGSGHSMESMLAAVRADFRDTAGYTGISRIDPQVEAAMASVRRDRFVPPEAESLAYVNHPLGIGYGQTISQPFVVALMTQLLALERQDRVLEIGTGSGYQAAVLAELARQVYTVEIIPELAEQAAATLRGEGYDEVEVRAGDGGYGWPEAAPFDAIIVTAVAETVPPRLLEQLRDGGRMVLPLGAPDGAQMLVLISKDAQGKVQRRDVLPVRFVPLTGDHGANTD